MSARKTNLLLVLGICLSILLPAQFCNAQLSVQGYDGDDDHIGWAIGSDNTDCKRNNAADRDYEQKGGTFKGLFRFMGLQPACTDNQYGCYALVKGTNDSGGIHYSYISNTIGITTKEQAIEQATDPAFPIVTVLVAGCIPKPENANPAAPATPSENWSGWVKNDCFSKLTYQYRTKELMDLTPQFHYYFQAKNDYPVTVYFILSLKDADGRERFGTRHTIPPGGNIQFVEKMDKNYIRSMAIERVRFKSDVGDYAACGDDPTSAGASKTTPANKPPATNGIDLEPQTVKQKILSNLKANIRAVKLPDNEGNSLEITDVSVDSGGDGVTMRFSVKAISGGAWVKQTQTENVSFDQMARGLQPLDSPTGLGAGTNFRILEFGGSCKIEEELSHPEKSCEWIYDTGPNQQNYNELKALLGQLSGRPSSDTTQNTASTSQPATTPVTNTPPAKTAPKNSTQNTGATSQPANTTPATNTRPTNTAPSDSTQSMASTSQPVSTTPVTNTPPTNTAPALTGPKEYFDRGNSYAAEGRYDLAIADYTKSIQMNPNSAVAFNNRGLAYESAGKDGYDMAIADLTRSIQIDPSYAEAYNNRAYAYNLKGSSDLAIADCTKALQIKPDYANAYHNRGSAYAKKGSYDLAIADLTKALQINPDDADTYDDRGSAYDSKGSYDLAIADYTKAIEINPNDADAYTSRGSAYANKGSFDLAIADLTKGLQTNPNNALAYYYRGVSHAQKGSYDLAIADYTKVLQLVPAFAPAYYNRGVAYSQKGSYALAIADYSKAIQIKPDDADSYTNRGLAYANIGSYDLAIADHTKAGQLDPKNLNVYLTLAWTYFYQGRPVLAQHKAAAYLELNGLAGDSAPYAIIVGYLGLLKSGESAKTNDFLSGWLKQVKEDAWTTKILRYFHSEITAAQLLALATDNDKLTEAHTYIGEVQLINKAPDTAKVHFEWVRANGNKSFFEYTLALAELKRLDLQK